MEIKYRLAGLDGEATEDRVENLDKRESDEDLSKKYWIAFALNKQISVGKDGIKVLLNDL